MIVFENMQIYGFLLVFRKHARVKILHSSKLLCKNIYKI